VTTTDTITGSTVTRPLPRGRVAGRETRRAIRPAPVLGSRDAPPPVPERQAPRPLQPTWPETEASRDQVLSRAGSLIPASARQRRVGMTRVLDWLEAQPGSTWQERWAASGGDEADLQWVTRLPPGTGQRLGGTNNETTIRLGLATLLTCQVIRPSLDWILAQDYFATLKLTLTVNDPAGLARLRQAFEARPGGEFSKVCAPIARIVMHKGGPVSAITAGDCAQYWWARRDGGKSMNEGSLFYAVLFEAGIFGADAPPTITAATRQGQLSCEELIDRYDIACKPIRDLLVDYLKVRRPSIDYTSLCTVAGNLGLIFWKDIEEHHPGADSLRLTPEMIDGWKQRLRTIKHGNRAGQQRQVPENTLMHVRSFYADLAGWAVEEPERFGHLAAPCPVRADEVSFKKRRRHRKATMDQRTRTLSPVLPILVKAVEAGLRDSRERLHAARRAADGQAFTVCGQVMRRTVATTGSDRIYAIDAGTGKRHDLTREEERAFWTWAIVETLRHTGMRIEEMLELTHHSFCAYTLPSTGEVVPMLQVAPSKTDTERLLLVSPELGEVLAEVIERGRRGRQTLPLVSLWDPFERQWSPMMPFLFQRIDGGVDKAITRRFVTERLDQAVRTAGMTDPSGKPLHISPHDFRRIFATDALRAGLPPHIAAKILGHIDLNTTMGYAAIYPEDVITVHRAFVARRRALRPGEEYRDLTSAEWDEFLSHFELRKVELGVCTRDFGTPCIHEHACIRCPALRPDPAQQARLEAIAANLLDRLTDARQQGWLGEVAGIEVSIAAAEQKLQAMTQLAARHQVTHLGMPDFRSSACGFSGTRP
jgi:hypothetical protein